MQLHSFSEGPWRPAKWGKAQRTVVHANSRGGTESSGSREGAAFTLQGGHTFSRAMPVRETILATALLKAQNPAPCYCSRQLHPGCMSEYTEMSPCGTSPPGQLCPHPTVPAVLGHSCGYMLLPLVSPHSASSHRVFTSSGASAIRCTSFMQVLGFRCQCASGGSLTAPRETSCPWREALGISVQARTSRSPHGRPELLLRSQMGSHICWQTSPHPPRTCCSLMTLNRAPAAATVGTRLHSLTGPGPGPDPPPPACWVDVPSWVLTLPGTSPELAAVPLLRSAHSAA